MNRLGVLFALASISILLVILSGCGPSNSELIQRSRQDYVNARPNLEADIKNAILRGDIIVGMSKEEVVAICGRPSHQTINIGMDGGMRAGWTFCGRNVFFGSDDKVVQITDR